MLEIDYLSFKKSQMFWGHAGRKMIKVKWAERRAKARTAAWGGVRGYPLGKIFDFQLSETCLPAFIGVRFGIELHGAKKD
jgi:hypothetical protein